MAVFKLNLDPNLFEDEQFTLIAIHCVLEDFRIAYLLNKHLNISLKKEDIDVKNTKLNTNYPLFEYLDINADITYNLIANYCKVESKKTNDTKNLFSGRNNSNKTTHYLIPEHKKVTYFLKIDMVFTKNKASVILNKILEIPQVITTYQIDTNNLKSKNNLIFY